MKYVIVGSGVAAIAAVEGIRKFDAKGKIVIVTEEEVPTYGRPLISYFLAGKIGPEQLSLRPESFYRDLGVEVKLGTRISGLDTKAKKITTEDNKKISYDRLLLATGGKPFVPPIGNIEGPDVYGFTTLAHAEALQDAAGDLKKAVVVGGGMIGLKAAEGLSGRDVSVSVVELAPRVLSAAMDEISGNLLARRLEEAGVKIFCNVSAKKIKRAKNGKVQGVVLSNGATLSAGAVVVAVGVIPNTDLAKAGRLKVGRGVVVNEFLQTSDPKVYAAGDLAEVRDMLTGEAGVIPIWPNAYSQGHYAGKNMAGAKVPYPGSMPMNSIAFFGLPTVSVGIVNPKEGQGFEVVKELNEEDQTYRKLVFRKDKLVGYVLVGDVDLAGLYTGFVRFSLPVDDEIKEKLIHGEPSALLWPDEFFSQQWNPGAATALGSI